MVVDPMRRRIVMNNNPTDEDQDDKEDYRGADIHNRLTFRMTDRTCNVINGGEGGIRTRGAVPRSQHFQCCQFNHSCPSPVLPILIANCRWVSSVASAFLTNKPIGNHQSAMSWRRGWDSNPRWP